MFFSEIVKLRGGSLYLFPALLFIPDIFISILLFQLFKTFHLMPSPLTTFPISAQLMSDPDKWTNSGSSSTLCKDPCDNDVLIVMEVFFEILGVKESES